MEFKCGYMTPFGCPARDTAKNLMILEMIECNYKDYEFCKEQCCRGCTKICNFRCGQVIYRKEE